MQMLVILVILVVLFLGHAGTLRHQAGIFAPLGRKGSLIHHLVPKTLRYELGKISQYRLAQAEKFGPEAQDLKKKEEK